MADSLFDNRYRYDYIYPRGRSGETLRAVDTQDNDRLVVIKRPAPNDAPPIRAGQEVSILNERKALTRLVGHPAATALLGSGQFFVGGVAHQYIVMERGQGTLVSDIVRELAGRGERMAELEMLVIVDGLIDLLQTAHSHDIVYNDVDAKHLFWDRDTYRLKVIDWGNAVFLEGDEITPQGISRQSDIFQVGELLYSIVSGGGRADTPRDAGEDFLLTFGNDAERVSPRLQAIISKAVHPNAKLRYRSITDLRKALTEYRDPLERERNALLGRVTERLRHNRSKDELQGLLDTLNPALAMDPGHPATRSAQAEIMARLRDLEVAGDLDAARIYLESGNWSRAVDLLDELRGSARAEMRALIDLLLECARLLLDARLQPVPQAISNAIALIFEGQNDRAAYMLLTSRASDDHAFSVQWLMTERISAHTPDLMLLRPNLYRLDIALSALSGEGISVTESRAIITEINVVLDTQPSAAAVSLIDLRDCYRSVVDKLTALGTLLETLNSGRGLPDRKLPLSSLERALNAAMALADNMHVVGRQATGSPRDALHALDSSQAIDPTNPAWEAVSRMLNGLYELLGSYQTYVPAADGSDLESWLTSTRQDLLPFQERLFDEMLVSMIDGLEIASHAWGTYAEATIQGDRIGAITALTDEVNAVSTISPTLAGWLNQVRTIVTNAQYVERHALFGGLGRALADGWEAFDRGRLADAERLGQQGYEIARTDPQRFAAGRLRDLAERTRTWIDRNVVNNAKGTQAALHSAEGLYTQDEIATRDHFSAQMPSKDTYLKAMGKGLVELYSRSSTAATRILFFNYILLGVLDAHEGNLEDAEFWQEAAVKTLGEYGQRHPLTRALSEFTERRRDLNAGADLLNEIVSSAALPTLDSARKKLEANPQARTLAAGAHSIRELENALRDWSDGEFRPAGIKLENAINAVNEVEQAASITLTAYRAWLMELQAAAAELHNQSRQMMSAIEQKPDKPVDAIRSALRRMVATTEQLLGETYAGTLRSWRESYESFLNVYTDNSVRRSEKLNRFNQLFRAMFIDRHPAYPLYRHWYDLTDQSPEFPAPPTDEPTPQIREEDYLPEVEYQMSPYDDPPQRVSLPRIRLSRRILFVVGGGILLLVIIAVVGSALNSSSQPPEVAVTITDTPTPNLTTTQAALFALSSTSTFTPPPTFTLDPNKITPTLPLDLITATLIPSVTALVIEPPPLPGQATPIPTNTPLPTFTPTDTDTPTITPTLTNTPTPTNTATATLPPQGLQGEQDVLSLLQRLPALPWDANVFSLVSAIDQSYWRLGSTDPSDSDVISIALPADLMETYYGNNAASRIRRMDVELTLTTFNPNMLDASQVYFGALLQNSGDPTQTAGAQIELARQGVLRFSQRAGETVTSFSVSSVSVYVVRIRLERNPANGAITVYVNGEQLGTPIDFANPDTNLLPVLYVRSGGVIVSVTKWTVSLR